MTFRSRTLLIAILLAFSIFYTSHLHASATATGPNDATPVQEPQAPDVEQSFQLRYASVSDVITVVRAVYGLRHLAVDETRNLLTVRDSADNVEAARRLIARYDTRPPTTLVSFELVALDPKPGGQANGSGLLRADTAIVGNGGGRIEVRRAPIESGQWLDLAVNVRSRIEGDEVSLQLEIESAVLRAGDENTRASTRGTWRSSRGGPLWVQLPLHVDFDGQSKMLALRVTPRVTEAPGQG